MLGMLQSHDAYDDIHKWHDKDDTKEYGVIHLIILIITLLKWMESVTQVVSNHKYIKMENQILLC